MRGLRQGGEAQGRRQNSALYLRSITARPGPGPRSSARRQATSSTLQCSASKMHSHAHDHVDGSSCQDRPVPARASAAGSRLGRLAPPPATRRQPDRLPDVVLDNNEPVLGAAFVDPLQVPVPINVLQIERGGRAGTGACGGCRSGGSRPGPRRRGGGFPRGRRHCWPCRWRRRRGQGGRGGPFAPVDRRRHTPPSQVVRLWRWCLSRRC